jgi:hypothetical protein
MFKGFSDSSRNKEFHGFPNLNFQMNNEAYGFSGCMFWLDAAVNKNTSTDSTLVSFWQDKIQSIRFVQTTAGNQPTYLTSYAPLNNNPVIFFNAKTMSASPVFLQQPQTTAVVFQGVVSASINQMFGDSTTNFNYNWGGTGAGYNGIGCRINGSPNSSTYGEDTNPHIAIFTKERIIADGAQQHTWSLNFIPQISNFYNTSQQYIAEIICFNKILTQAECVQLCDNINSKYAIY